MLSRLSRSRILLNNLRTPSPNNYSTSIPSTSSSSLNSKSSSSNSNSSTESTTPRPEINYISFETLYPFFLLSVMTSLALNLSHNRSSFKDEELNLKAKISVLEKIVDRLRERGNEEENGATNLKDMVKGKGKEKRNNTWLTEEEQESIERELELVGLGRNKGKSVESILKNVGSKVGTSWREVFLGKKGKEWEEVDETDWEKGKFWISCYLYLAQAFVHWFIG